MINIDFGKLKTDVATTNFSWHRSPRNKSKFNTKKLFETFFSLQMSHRNEIRRWTFLGTLSSSYSLLLRKCLWACEWQALATLCLFHLQLVRSCWVVINSGKREEGTREGELIGKEGNVGLRSPVVNPIEPHAQACWPSYIFWLAIYGFKGQRFILLRALAAHWLAPRDGILLQVGVGECIKTKYYVMKCLGPFRQFYYKSLLPLYKLIRDYSPVILKGNLRFI